MGWGEEEREGRGDRMVQAVQLTLASPAKASASPTKRLVATAPRQPAITQLSPSPLTHT